MINKPQLLQELAHLNISDVVISDGSIKFVWAKDLEITYTGDGEAIYPPEYQEAFQILNDHVYQPDYREERLTKYDLIGEQLDYLWHDIDNGTLNKDGLFYNHIKEVKESTPKP